jgi:hypothetical protein
MAKVISIARRLSRETILWLSDDQIINLVMDNAGGCRKKEIIAAYEELIMHQYKIQLVDQILTLP